MELIENSDNCDCLFKYCNKELYFLSWCYCTLCEFHKFCPISLRYGYPGLHTMKSAKWQWIMSCYAGLHWCMLGHHICSSGNPGKHLTPHPGNTWSEDDVITILQQWYDVKLLRNLSNIIQKLCVTWERLLSFISRCHHVISHLWHSACKKPADWLLFQPSWLAPGLWCLFLTRCP